MRGGGLGKKHDDRSCPEQGNLFHSTTKYCEETLGPTSLYRYLNAHWHRLFPDEMFADLFQDIGRESVPPRILAVVMVLQKLEGTMIRSAIRGLLRVADETLQRELRATLRREDDYASAGKPACDWSDEQAREALIDALCRDAYAALAVRVVPSALPGRTQAGIHDYLLMPSYVRIRRRNPSKLVLLGEGHLRAAVREYLAHYHGERNHQGLAGQLILPPANINRPGPIVCRERRGSLLRFYPP